MSPHRHSVQIYYEDTDHSGAVYHANYLKYFERAREHLLGTDELVRLLEEDGIGFVVYKASLTYKRSVGFGQRIEIVTTVSQSSDYRLSFVQRVQLPQSDEILVDGFVDLVCVDAQGNLTALPSSVVRRLASSPHRA